MNADTFINRNTLLRSTGFIGIALALAMILDGTLLEAGFLGRSFADHAFLISAVSAFLGMSLLLAGAFLFTTLTPKRWFSFFAPLSAMALSGQFLLNHALSGPALFSVFLGAVFGAGIATTVVWWSSAFIGIRKLELIQILSLGCIFTAACKMLMLCLPWPFSAIFSALLLTGSAVIPAPEPTELDGDTAVADSTADERLKAIATLLVKNWVCIVALIPFVLLEAFTWSGSMQGSLMLNNPRIETCWGISIGLALAGLLFIFLSLNLKQEHYVVSFLVLPLLGISGLLLSWFFGNFESSVLQVLTTIPTGLALAIPTVLLTIRLNDSDNKRQRTALMVCLIVSALALLFLVSYVLWPLLGDTLASDLTLSSLTLYLLGTAIWLAIGRLSQARDVVSDNNNASDTSSNSSGETEAQIEIKLEQFAERYHLSLRERELLLWLTQGHNVPWIAEHLYVSVNTVRTHIKRIYSKAAVHTREELLNLIYGL